jgi:hypothetical protein
MVEIFNYTERVVNMIRPRKLLFMAIGKFVKCSVPPHLTVAQMALPPALK